MVEEDGEKPKFVFPTRVGEEEEEVEEERLAVLCSVPVEEAVGFCARLEEEGIVCGAREAAAVEPAGDSTRYAEIYVHAEDLEMAREVLARPPEAIEEVLTPQEAEARLAAAWICPKCRRPGLDLLPVAKGVQHARMALLAVIVLTLAVALLTTLVPAFQGLDDFPNWLIWGWVIVVAWLGWMSVPEQREKRCAGCGWESRQAMASGESGSRETGVV
jgi:hypothetical protein